MVNPQILEEKPLTLTEVKGAIKEIEKRDTELNFLSNKVKNYVEGFATMSSAKKAELSKKLADLSLIRLKEEHLAKIIDFLPQNITELKVVLQAYPLNLPKKDQESIIGVVSEFRE